MLHELKLQEKYFNYIKNGTKKIELRLFDEKRQKIKVNDTIKFLKEPNLQESFEVNVIGLLQYNNFKNLFNDFDIKMLADVEMTKKELINVLEVFYNKEEQNKYGVLGIRVELI